MKFARFLFIVAFMMVANTAIAAMDFSFSATLDNIQNLFDSNDETLCSGKGEIILDFGKERNVRSIIFKGYSGTARIKMKKNDETLVDYGIVYDGVKFIDSSAEFTGIIINTNKEFVANEVQIGFIDDGTKESDEDEYTQTPTTENVHFSGVINGGKLVSRDKPAVASSNYKSGDIILSAENVTDGSTSKGWSCGGGDTAPYVIIDLERKYSISGVIVYPRSDVNQAGTRKNFRVLASNTQDFTEFEVLGEVGSNGFLQNQKCIVECQTDIPYRYVKVEKTDGAYFFISEIEVYTFGEYALRETNEKEPIITNIKPGAVEPALISLSHRYNNFFIACADDNKCIYNFRSEYIGGEDDKFRRAFQVDGQLYVPKTLAEKIIETSFDGYMTEIDGVTYVSCNVFTDNGWSVHKFKSGATAFCSEYDMNMFSNRYIVERINCYFEQI